MHYKLSDEVLAAIARSVQVGILTGTDIVDHLRLIEVEPDLENQVRDGSGPPLVLTAGCRDQLERNIDDLLQRAKQLSSPNGIVE